MLISSQRGVLHFSHSLQYFQFDFIVSSQALNPVQMPGKFRGLGLVYVGLNRGTKSLQQHHLLMQYPLLYKNLILCVFQNRMIFLLLHRLFPITPDYDAAMCDLKYKPIVIQ